MSAAWSGDLHMEGSASSERRQSELSPGLPPMFQQPRSQSSVSSFPPTKQPPYDPVRNAVSTNAMAVTPSVSAELSNVAKNIQEIIDRERVPSSQSEMADDDENDAGDDDEPIDLEDQQQRTKELTSVLLGLSALWRLDSEHLDVVVQKLADGSRDRKSAHVTCPLSPTAIAPC